MEIDDIKWNDDGLVPVIISDVRSGLVLTLAWANREALKRTIATRETHLWSRSRKKLWRKGDESGNSQRVVEIRVDCDSDAVLYRVAPKGPACHTGTETCFSEVLLEPKKNEIEDDGAFFEAIAHLLAILEERKKNPPPDSYIAKLYERGVDRIGKKLGEEAVEVVIAAKNEDDNELIWESADLIFHLLALLAFREIPLAKIGDELLRRKIPKAGS